MKNKLSDLNNHLFAQLERLGEELTAEQIEQEAKRGEAIVAVAETIVKNADLQLDAELAADRAFRRRAWAVLLCGLAAFWAVVGGVVAALIN